MNTIYIPVNRVRTSRRENTDIILAALGVAVCMGLSFFLSKLWGFSGEFIAAAVIGSVNRSVWESVKIMCIAMLLWFVVEFFLMHVNYYRMTAAAVVGTSAAAACRICLAFICSGILGFSPQWLEWSITAISLIVGQWAAVRIQRYPGRVEEYFLWAVTGLSLLMYALLSFTVNPPHIGLFADPISGGYGFR